MPTSLGGPREDEADSGSEVRFHFGEEGLRDGVGFEEDAFGHRCWSWVCVCLCHRRRRRSSRRSSQGSSIKFQVLNVFEINDKIKILQHETLRGL
jgi:hypothetical protein